MTTTEMRLLPPVSVVVPHLNRAEHLKQSLDSWSNQTYGGQLDVVVVDFSSSIRDSSVARVVYVDNARWNICRARNVGAKCTYGDLLIFSPADAVIVPSFVSDVVAQWDLFDAWFVEGVMHKVPHDPAADGLIVVKRWVNTRVRGFSEQMMENPHGWGYDSDDYRLRITDMLSTSGGSVGDYPVESAMFCIHDDASRVSAYDFKDMAESRRRHEAYSAKERSKSYIANASQPEWGVR